MCANSVDPNQMPCSAASDLGLHCLPKSQKWDAMHKWVNILKIPKVVSRCQHFHCKQLM